MKTAAHPLIKGIKSESCLISLPAGKKKQKNTTTNKHWWGWLRGQGSARGCCSHRVPKGEAVGRGAGLGCADLGLIGSRAQEDAVTHGSAALPVGFCSRGGFRQHQLCVEGAGCGFGIGEAPGTSRALAVPCATETPRCPVTDSFWSTFISISIPFGDQGGLGSDIFFVQS